MPARPAHGKLVRNIAVGMACLALTYACNGNSPTSPAGQSLQAAFQDASFKVATWNIRSGMGIRGFTTTTWDHTTVNCTDRSKPLNAWGIGLPQAELERLRADQTIVAVAIQEAWYCGSPANVNSVLGFRTASQERNGVALLARHGFATPVVYHQIDVKEGRWLIGGDVCLNPACTQAMPMYSTHFGAADEDHVPAQAQNVIDFLASRPTPHLFMGDLNIFRIDAWNPRVPCTSDDHPARLDALARIENAGYLDSWKATQAAEGWTGMATRNGCGTPNGSLFKRIDYVFGKGLRALATDRFARAAPGGDAPSDHAGLIATLAPVVKRDSASN
jgi:endonuclease/exonuclease/phosphatase family metal-dependent hydrolase